MVENLIPQEGRRELSDSYKLRSKFWATSVCAHIVWIFIATQIHLEPKPLRPIYDEFIRRLERRAIVLRPPVVKKATATAETRVGKSIDPRGAAKSLRTIIATAPKAPASKQIVFSPVNLPEAKIDVPAPNMVSRVETILPPPPSKAKAKQFTAPTRSQQTVTPRNTEVNAALPDAQAVTATVNLAVGTALPKIAAKQFTPPPPSKQQPKQATPLNWRRTWRPRKPSTNRRRVPRCCQIRFHRRRRIRRSSSKHRQHPEAERVRRLGQRRSRKIWLPRSR